MRVALTNVKSVVDNASAALLAADMDATIEIGSMMNQFNSQG